MKKLNIPKEYAEDVIHLTGLAETQKRLSDYLSKEDVLQESLLYRYYGNQRAAVNKCASLIRVNGRVFEYFLRKSLDSALLEELGVY